MSWNASMLAMLRCDGKSARDMCYRELQLCHATVTLVYTDSCMYVTVTKIQQHARVYLTKNIVVTDPDILYIAYKDQTVNSPLPALNPNF